MEVWISIIKFPPKKYSMPTSLKAARITCRTVTTETEIDFYSKYIYLFIKGQGEIYSVSIG